MKAKVSMTDDNVVVIEDYSTYSITDGVLMIQNSSGKTVGVFARHQWKYFDIAF